MLIIYHHLMHESCTINDSQRRIMLRFYNAFKEENGILLKICFHSSKL